MKVGACRPSTIAQQHSGYLPAKASVRLHTCVPLLQGEPAAGLTQALMRMADYFIIDANDERMAGVICRPSLRVPERIFTFVFRVQAYNRKASQPTSLAAQTYWQYVDLQLLSGEPEDVLPLLPVTDRVLVSALAGSSCACCTAVRP